MVFYDKQVWVDLLVLGVFIWIAYYDVKFHLIRNVDLLLLFVVQSFFYIENFLNALVAVLIYTALNFIAKGKIGSGDVKLSFLCAAPLSSVNEILNSISITWITGGAFALFSRTSAIPFAPFMIIGTYIVKIW